MTAPDYLPWDSIPASESSRRSSYESAFPTFAAALTPSQRRGLNGSTSAAWENQKTFALPVNPDSPAYSSDEPDPVIEALEEIAAIRGAMAKIALWVNDQTGGLDMVRALDRFRIAVARICESKNPRLEAYMVSLAIGLNLRGNSNGSAIAHHFRLKPQQLHELLGDTCQALGLPKPLAKAKKDRYAKTQHRHHLKPQTA